MLGVGSPILWALLSIVVQELLIGELGMQELLVAADSEWGVRVSGCSLRVLGSTPAIAQVLAYSI